MVIQILNSLQEHYTFLYAENTIGAKIEIAMMIFFFCKEINRMSSFWENFNSFSKGLSAIWTVTMKVIIEARYGHERL
jgi:hypothetical protein